MPTCKNVKSKTYTGRGYHASGEKLGSIMKR